MKAFWNKICCIFERVARKSTAHKDIDFNNNTMPVKENSNVVNAFSDDLLEKANQAVIDGKVQGKVDKYGNFIVYIDNNVSVDSNDTDNDLKNNKVTKRIINKTK